MTRSLRCQACRAPVFHSGSAAQCKCTRVIGVADSSDHPEYWEADGADS